jgi:hypothetical protein
MNPQHRFHPVFQSNDVADQLKIGFESRAFAGPNDSHRKTRRFQPCCHRISQLVGESRAVAPRRLVPEYHANRQARAHLVSGGGPRPFVANRAQVRLLIGQRPCPDTTSQVQRRNQVASPCIVLTAGDSSRSIYRRSRPCRPSALDRCPVHSPDGDTRRPVRSPAQLI